MLDQINMMPVFTISASPNVAVDGLVFAACQAGLMKSQDSGETWASAYDDDIVPANTATTWVTLSPAFAKDKSVFAAIHGAMLKSADEGLTWSITRLALPAPVVSKICLSPNYLKDGTLFIATLEDGVFRSTDYGATYERQNFGLYDTNVMSLHLSPDFADDHTLFAGTEACLFRSNNGGHSWQETTLPIGSGSVLSLAALQKRLVIATEEKGLFQSPDNGDSWQPIAETTELGEVKDMIPSNEGLYILAESDLLLLQNDNSAYKMTSLYTSDAAIASVTLLDANTGKYILGFADGAILLHS